MYTPVKAKFGVNPVKATSLMSPAGVNLRTAPQFLDPKFALNIQNYEIEDTGKLKKRKGLSNTDGIYKNCVGNWRFNEGSGAVAYDSTTYNNNGTITNASYVTTNNVTGLEFDGVSGNVLITDAAMIQDVFDGGGSTKMRIYPESTGGGGQARIVAKDARWQVRIDSLSGTTAKVTFIETFSGTNGIWSSTDRVINLNQWNEIFVTYDADSTTNDPVIYVNGSSISITESSTPVGTRTSDAGQNLYIGNNAGGTVTFDGIIDEVAFYSTALTATQVQNVYNRRNEYLDSPISLFKKYTDNIYIVGFGTTIAAYYKNERYFRILKNDFSVNSGFDGIRYGDYFFACNGVDKIWRIYTDLSITQVANSPATTTVLAVIGPRLFAGYGDTVQYSEVDAGGAPPFTNWNNGTLATDGGKVYYRNAGDVRAIVPLGEYNVVFSDKGFFAFYINTIDVGGNLTKKDDIISYTEDFGGTRGAITTKKGIFYANEAGLWNLVSVGKAPFNKQETPIATLLGNAYFDNIDASNGEIVYDQKKNTIYFTCAKNSDTNNFVIGYNTEFGALFFFNNWNISRWLTVDNVIYGSSDVKTAIYKCFDGDTDDGQIIGTEYYQELKLGDLETRQMLKGCYVQGFLAQSSVVNVKFDIYDITGRPITNKLKYQWTAQYNLNGFDGYNSAHYSSSAYGGDEDFGNLIESFDGCRPFIRNFHRIRVRITSNDRMNHILTWIKLDSRIKAPIRRRKLQITS